MKEQDEGLETEARSKGPVAIKLKPRAAALTIDARYRKLRNAHVHRPAFARPPNTEHDSTICLEPCTPDRNEATYTSKLLLGARGRVHVSAGRKSHL